MGREEMARMLVREVVAGVDDSIAGRAAVDWAAQRAHDRGLRLNLVRVVPDPWVYRQPGDYRQAMLQAKHLLEAESSRVAALMPQLKIVTTRRTGETAVVLRLLSDTADLVAVGSDRSPDNHGEGFGSVSFQAAVLSRSPVAVIPASRPSDSSGVVAGVDGSADSGAALDFAAAEALRLGEDLTVVHVQLPSRIPTAAGVIQPAPNGPEQDGLALLSSTCAAARDRHPGLGVHQALETNGSPASALIRVSAHARLLVIGLNGGGGARKPIGMIAATILQHLPCPTILTRPTRTPNAGRPGGPVLPVG
jgi:nucleotide-binding universal stress UspA family protein